MVTKLMGFIKRRLGLGATSDSYVLSSLEQASLTPLAQPATDANPLYFLHIPKTGGSSIHELLAEHFGERMSQSQLWDHIKFDDPSTFAKHNIFAGHFGMALPTLLQRPTWTFTFLRDPVARTVSHFKHVKRDPNHPFHRYMQGKTLADFLSDPMTIPLVYNVQARYLASDASGADGLLRIPRHDANYGSLSMTWELMSYGMKDEDIRTRSFVSLDKMQFVGFLEYFEKSIQELAKLLGIDAPIVPRANVSDNDHDVGQITNSIRARIMDLTRIDTEIYETALARFKA